MSLDTAKAVATMRGLTKKFDNRIEAAKPFYPEVCANVDSKGADEGYGWLGDLPGMREWLGDRKWKELRASNFSLKNKLWEESIPVEKTAIDDDRAGIYDMLFESLGDSAAYHPDDLFFQTLVDGETKPCFDGQTFFDTDHAWGESGTQSNDLTYNASSHTAVTSAEFRASFHAARTAMARLKSDTGRLLNRSNSTGFGHLICIVPPGLELAAREGLTATILSNNSNVVIDAPKIVMSANLTDDTKWYLLNVGSALRPFVFQAREPISRQFKGHDDIETKIIKFMTQARYNLGYLAWWAATLTTFN